MSEVLLGHIGLKQEKVFGEAALQGAVYGEIRSESISMNNNFIMPETANSLRHASHVIPGPLSADGNMGLYLEPEGPAPWILKGLFGQVASAAVAAGVYEHSYVPLQSNSLPSFNIEVDHEAACHNWLGCTFTNVALTIAPNGLLELDAGVLAQRPTEIQTPSTPSFAQTPPWNGANVEFNINGESSLKFETFRLDFSNEVEPVHTLNGKRYCRRHHAGGFRMRGSVTLEFDSPEHMRRLWGSPAAVETQNVIEPGSLSISITHAIPIAEGHYYSLTIELPEIYYEAAPANIAAPDRRILQTVSFVPTYSRSAEKLVEVTLTNSESSYPDPD